MRARRAGRWSPLVEVDDDPTVDLRVDNFLQWLPDAIWLFGTSYLATVLVVWRIWLVFDDQAASTAWVRTLEFLRAKLG